MAIKLPVLELSVNLPFIFNSVMPDKLKKMPVAKLHVSVDDMTFAMRHDFLMEEAYGTFEDFLVRNDFIYEIAHA